MVVVKTHTSQLSVNNLPMHSNKVFLSMVKNELLKSVGTVFEKKCLAIVAGLLVLYRRTPLR